PGLENEFEEGEMLEPVDHFPVSARLPPAREHRDPPPIARIPLEGGVDRAGVSFRRAPHEREVAALHPSLPDLPREMLIRMVSPRHDEQSGRVAIEPVHDPGTLRRTGRIPSGIA